jgi:hypothetical protein
MDARAHGQAFGRAAMPSMLQQGRPSDSCLSRQQSGRTFQYCTRSGGCLGGDPAAPPT